MKNNGSDSRRKETVITLNRKAYHEYEIFNKYIAGLVLLGTEVKSLRLHKANIQDSYARIRNDELWLINSNIPEYKFGNINNHEPLRDRKLLLHRDEIRKIKVKLQEKGFTLIPLKLFFSGAAVKVEIGTAKGKKLYDKREAIKHEELKKQIRRIRI